MIATRSCGMRFPSGAPCAVAPRARPAGQLLGPFSKAFRLGGQKYCKGPNMLDAALKWHDVALYRVLTAFHFDDPPEALFELEQITL